MNRTVASAAARPSLKNWNISVNIRTATTSSWFRPPLVDMTMSKILSVAIAIVVVTVTIEPRMSGTITLKKIWRSLAPSRRAASWTSAETPLIAAEKTTMAKPVWSQMRMTISAGRLKEKVVAHEMGWLPRAVQLAFRSPYCGWPGGCQAETNFQMTVAPT